MIKKIGSALLLLSPLAGQDRFIPSREELQVEPIPSPEKVQSELDQAQKDFERAKSLFIPWYTGPLITGSANNAPPGKWNIQPYLFLDNTYAVFNNNRKSINIPDIFTINPLFLVQTGITKWLDISLAVKGFFRWQSAEYSQGYGDTSVTFGIQLLKQSPWVPSIRLTVGESFPTGRFEKFDPKKASIESTGSGAFTTNLSLNFNKIIWSIPKHPISLRFTSAYSIPNHRVDVKNFNTYGGGFGTRGSVCLGHTFAVNFAVEVSLTQKWVFATDFAYALGLKTTFRGNPGVSSFGTPARVGGSSSDQLSIAPAIEYNVSDRGGFIGGVWFSVTGRNSGHFVSGVLSYSWLI